MMSANTKSIFITGTDTDAGKTYVSVLLLKAANELGLTSIGFKPIAAGCEQTVDGLRNDDALSLQAAASLALPYDLVNPIAFAEPIAPHIAAQRGGADIDMQVVAGTMHTLQNQDANFLLVEGAGGWRLPIDLGRRKKNENVFLSDFVAHNKLPVVLVVGMKLGCLNHAALTIEQIKRDGCHIVGWIANQVDPKMDCYAENLASLTRLMDVPFLGEVGYHADSIKFNGDALSSIVHQ